MADESIAAPIREFIMKLTHAPVQDDEDIFAAGYVNSLVAMQLVAFVEKHFGIEIDAEDLDLANFKSVSDIAALVQRKRAAAA